MQPHGLMFHHFHGRSADAVREHRPGQGSISGDQFEQILAFIGVDRILPAREFLGRAVAGSLDAGHVCVTFDDNLRCQYDVALPVLERHGITAFWFVYTSVNLGRLEPLELYRRFRTDYFDRVEAFYEAFERCVGDSMYAGKVRAALGGFAPDRYLVDFPFYTHADRRFRFIRDEVLGPHRYRQIMDLMMSSAGMKTEKLACDLWMDDHCLRRLHEDGHVVGLHSHTHPTRLGELPVMEQAREYWINHDHLTGVLGQPPRAMSHPCNSYSPQTLGVLCDLGIQLGFRANRVGVAGRTRLETPREDHANILRAMRPSNAISRVA